MYNEYIQSKPETGLKKFNDGNAINIINILIINIFIVFCES